MTNGMHEEFLSSNYLLLAIFYLLSMEIIPAIMPKNYEDLKNKIALVRGLVPIIQIDLCDGQFVKTVTWPFHGEDERSLDNILNEREGLPFWEDVDFELDLMVANAMEEFDTYVRLGPKRILFHLEAMPLPESFLEFLEGIDLYTRENIQIGVAINSTTNIELIFPFVSKIDFVQCMGIEHIGRQGEPFDEKVLEHIKKLRKEFPEIVISVDGGVSLETGAQLLDAGADHLIVGSALFNSIDIHETLKEFENL
jgi:ribulose-phosphate 3-epimerase